MKEFLVKTLLVLAALLNFEFVANCQNSNEQLIPKVAPATPEAASLGRYGNYQVSYFTGLPQIEIPLHEIEVGELKVPISISYHPSGIKVTDRASCIGLGWTLNAGGAINRTMVGREDEHGYLQGQMKPNGTISTATTEGLTYLNDVNRNNIDTEPDIYHYSVPGHSGKFFFNVSNGNKPVMIPYNSMLVQRTGAASMTFKLTDGKGSQFKFNDAFETGNGSGSTFIRTAWKLSKMIAPNRRDSISFTYTPWTGTLSTDLTEWITVIDMVNNYTSPGIYSAHPGQGGVRNESVQGTEQLISQITFPFGKVAFEALTNREDYAALDSKKKMDRIVVYTQSPSSATYNIFKIIEFYHSYFTSTDGTSTKRLRLDSIRVNDADNVVVQRYRFAYNTSQNLPEYTSRSRDYWGYFNNKANNTLVPRTTLTYQPSVTPGSSTITIGSNLADGRNPDPTYMQANVLTKIYYPTGGRSEFSYQTNQYSDAGQTKYAGGLRIYQIRNYDGVSSTPLLKTLKYGANESGIGRANFLLDSYYFQRTLERRYYYEDPIMLPLCLELQGQRRERVYVSAPAIQLEPFDGAPVVYPVVTEYNGDETSNTGKTVYTFTDAADLLVPVPSIGMRVVQSNFFKRGLLSSKTEYKKTGTSTYQILKSISHTYQAFPDSMIQDIGFKCSKILVSDSNFDSDLFLGPDIGGCSGQHDSNSYIFGFYFVQTGDNRVISTTEMDYDQNDAARSYTATSNFQYENRFHQNRTRETTQNHLGEVVERVTKYPHEGTGTVYTEMVQKHYYDYPIEETTLINAAVVERTNYNYYKYFDYVFKPQTIYRQIQSGPSELEVTFSGYDGKGNPTGYIARDNITNSFLWAYNSLFPLAKAVGAPLTQIAYTSFEEGNNQGYWSFSGTAAGGKTGDRSHALSTSVTKSGLTSSASYVVSYWAKGGTPTVTGVVSHRDAPAAEADGWRYFEKTVTNRTSVTVSGNSSIFIDELRLFPVGSLLTTYTFAPGIGVTSVADENSIPTFYRYDKFGRLAFIKDSQGKIVQYYRYNYKK